MKKHAKELTTDEINKLSDADIDFSDIPKLDKNFWDNATFVTPESTAQITLRVKNSVLNYFKASGKGYQTRINQVLESYMRSQIDSDPDAFGKGNETRINQVLESYMSSGVLLVGNTHTLRKRVIKVNKLDNLDGKPENEPHSQPHNNYSHKKTLKHTKHKKNTAQIIQKGL
jgi:uncharacterized protein (DUF4415 family)